MIYKFKNAIFKPQVNTISLHADIIVEDESGKQWSFSAATFLSHLKPHEPSQLPYQEWHAQFWNSFMWNDPANARYDASNTKGWLEDQYRMGLSPQEAKDKAVEVYREKQWGAL